MSHRINSLIFALVFLIVLQSTKFAFRILVPALVLYSAALMYYNFRYLKQHGFYTFWIWIRQLFFLAAIVSIYFVQPAGYIQDLYLVLMTLLIFLFELGINFASEQLSFLQTLLTYFGLSLGILAVNFYFLPRLVLTLAAITILTFMVARSSFGYVPQPPARKNYFSALLALSILELGWALSFLPFHFTALAVILFNAFYVIWIVIYYHLYNNLTPKKVYFHLVFSSLVVLLVFLSTPWK